jgi:tetratricopeptide (TPR) repeat protein
MKLRLLIYAVALAVGLGVQPAGAQERERGLHVRVGALPDEAKAGQEVDLWAVIIGVSRYKLGDQSIDGNQIPNLKSASEDARRVYDFLYSSSGGGFRPESEGGHMILLTDEQATRSNVEQALASLRRTRPSDYFVLYIAAHGTLVPQRTADGRTEEVPYFVLYDTDLRDPGKTALPMDSFQRLVREVPARKGLVLSDTCHSAGVQLAGRGIHTVDTQRANNYFVESMKQVSAGVGFISAADQTELSYERDDINAGVFTHCLTEGLSGLADANQDGTVNFKEIKDYLSSAVPAYTNGRQHPQSITTKIEANYIPLSVVNYGSSTADAGYGMLEISAPELDGVTVAVDGKPVEQLHRDRKTWSRVAAGTRTLTFTRGDQTRSIQVVVDPGRTKAVEVNLSFTDSDAVVLVPPPATDLTSVHLADDKPPAPAAEKLFAAGVRSFNQLEHERAVLLFNQAIRENGGAYADALVYRGRAEQSLGRKREAVISFQEALALRPSDFETRALYAEAQFNAGVGNVNDLLLELRDIARRHPPFEYARVVLADILLWRGDRIGAEHELRKAILANPNSPPAHMILADALSYQDNPVKLREAVDHGERALQLFIAVSEQRSAAQEGIAQSISNVIFGGGRYANRAALAEAHQITAKAQIRAYERGDLTDPDGALAAARKHLDEARRLAEVLKDRTRLMLVLATSAENYMMCGDVLAAIRDAEQALSSAAAPEYASLQADLHHTLYRAHASNQNFAKAVEHFRCFVDLCGSRLSPDEQRDATEELKRLKRLAGETKAK